MLEGYWFITMRLYHHCNMLVEGHETQALLLRELTILY
jgi:hypothetical protein